MIAVAKNKEDCKELLLIHFSELLAIAEEKCSESRLQYVSEALEIYKTLFDNNEPEQAIENVKKII